MKISIVTNLFPPNVVGGYELGCLTLARAAQSAGHEIEVLTSLSIGRLNKRPRPSDLYVRDIFEPIYEYEASKTGVPSPNEPAAFGGIVRSNSIALSHALETFQPDAIWVFNPLGLGPIGILEAAISSGVPVTIHLMDHIDETVAANQIGFEMLARWERAKNHVSAIACSEKTLAKNQLYGRYRTSSIIPNGVALQHPKPARTQKERTNEFRLVYFGQVERAKGVTSLVEAVSEAKNRFPDMKLSLDIIGSGSVVYRQELSARIEALRVSSQISQLGFINLDELLASLSRYDLAIFPLSSNEPFAYVVPEAISEGLPVIVTREAGCAEFLSQTYPLFLNDPRDIANIADRIHWAFEHPEEVQNWQKLLLEDIYSKCDLHHVCLPACIEVLSKHPVEKQADWIPFGQQSSLSTWQVNRHITALTCIPTILHCQPPIGKRIERWVRKRIPSHYRRAVTRYCKRAVGAIRR